MSSIGFAQGFVRVPLAISSFGELREINYVTFWQTRGAYILHYTRAITTLQQGESFIISTEKVANTKKISKIYYFYFVYRMANLNKSTLREHVVTRW